MLTRSRLADSAPSLRRSSIMPPSKPGTRSTSFHDRNGRGCIGARARSGPTIGRSSSPCWLAVLKSRRSANRGCRAARVLKRDL
jgi:hypothetical protein